ncbi:hypothetical protein CYMTET_42319 [Cymbomonas tetramitiformis]|uniref:EF-hand domain-containing protein n=1 Tax=Cymbomonas tetramitiformis TaxID=36881 RepID=A0AAE0C5N8_9CHLO|nr:hypothetical protein CYMTET_42320 [Cymbomonas tetramitiformis]KAK3248211.1 hypothetical protein CYMTET_42319 [Cymbomonas tetramitiformis]
MVGGIRRTSIFVLAWVFVGTCCYTYLGFEETGTGNVAASFYYAVQAGLAVGYGKLTEQSELGLLFTAFYELVGSAIIANFLAGFVSLIVSNVDSADAESPQEPIWKVRGFVFLGLWILMGIAFGTLHENWSVARSLYFSVAALCTAGLQAVDSSDDVSFLFVGLYTLTGVPIYAYTLGNVATRLARPMIQARRSRLQEGSQWRIRQLQEETDLSLEECLGQIFCAYDVDGSGTIDRKEIRPLIKFLSACKGYTILEEDVDFWMEDLDLDENDSISQDEFIQGMKREVLSTRT